MSKDWITIIKVNWPVVILLLLVLTLVVYKIYTWRKKAKDSTRDNGEIVKGIKSKKLGIIMYSLLALIILSIVGVTVWAAKYNNPSKEAMEMWKRTLTYREQMGKHAPEIEVPESFRGTVLYLNGNSIPAYTNGRYYIFSVPFHGTQFSMNCWYIDEKYIDSHMEYDPSLMSGSGVMEDIEIRGKYVEGVDLQYVESEKELEVVPEGFEKVVEDHDGIKSISYVKDNYAIRYMIYDEYEDWYLVKSPKVEGLLGKSYLRYEPSFMTGRE